MVYSVLDKTDRNLLTFLGATQDYMMSATNRGLMLVIDGVKYHLIKFIDESEFEHVVEKHVDGVFGDSVYFGKKKIKSLSGIGSIPDGYAITLNKSPHWYVVEVELSGHNVFNHIVPQVNKFVNGIKNDATKRELIRFMDREIRSQPEVEQKIKERFGEVYRFLADLVYDSPVILIIIDEKVNELEDVIVSIPMQTRTIEFKTFATENAANPQYAYEFEPLYSSKPLLWPSPRRAKTPEVSPPVIHAPNLPISWPRGLFQILEVAIMMRHGEDYRRATLEVAKQHKIDERSVADKCTRKLGLNTEQFKETVSDRQRLLVLLGQKFPTHATEIERHLP
jgi:hypothetical protein